MISSQAPSDDKRRRLRRWVLVSACMLLSLGLALTLVRYCSREPQRKWLMGYYVGYLADRYPLNELDWESLTHIAVGAALPRRDGSLDTTFYMSGNKGETWAKDVVRTAHLNDVKAILMLGGADTSENFREAIRHDNGGVLLRAILDTVEEFDFDGVDIDWEPMTEEDIPHVRNLAENIKQYRENIIMTVPIGSVNINRREDVPPSIVTLASSFDQVNLMTYGMHGAGWRDWHSWHPGALQGEKEATPMSIDSTVSTYTDAGLPAHKLGVGIGFYGACYRGITGPSETSRTMEVIADDNKMSYARVMDLYYNETIAHWDDKAKTPYLASERPIGPLQCNYVPFEDTRSVSLKARYAVNRGLGGAIVWNINQGYRSSQTGDERDALLRTIASDLGLR